MIVWDANMAHFGMRPAMQQMSIDECAAANAGPNGDIQEAAEASCSTPAGFGQGCGIYVRIERDWDSERAPNSPDKVEVSPSAFRRRGNVTERSRFRIRVNRAKGGDSYGLYRWANSKEIDYLPDCRLGGSGRKLDNFYVFGIGADSAHKLRSSGFDASETLHASSLRRAGPLPFQGIQHSPPRVGTIKVSMKLSVFAHVLAVSALTASAFGQQPSPAAPPKPDAPAQPALAQVAAPESNLAPDAVVLTVGNQTMTRAQFEVLLSALAENGRPATTSAQKRQVAEQYGELETMAQEARKRKLDESAQTKQMMAIQSDSFLANSLAKKISEDTHFTELDLRGYYDSHKSEFEEAQGSHILIRFKGSSVPLKPNEKDLTDEEALAKAQDIRKKILAGQDFATLAKAESDDAGSAAKGGELGTFKHGQMVPPFDQAAFSIPVGQVSEPVKTQFGYHIIKITSRDAKSFDASKAQIEKDLKPKMAKDALEQIKTHTPVKLNDAYFGPEEAAKPALTPVR